MRIPFVYQFPHGIRFGFDQVRLILGWGVHHIPDSVNHPEIQERMYGIAFGFGYKPNKLLMWRRKVSPTEFYDMTTDSSWQPQQGWK